MKNKTKTKTTKAEKIADLMQSTRGRYMSLTIETSKAVETISCKSLAIKDKTVVVQDRNNGNRNRVIAKKSLGAMHCGDDLWA